jgi:Cdc6-like AAA superfamily ATPase
MSIDAIKSEITRFLKSSTPEVMAIKGSWGVGKTYSWNKFLLDAKNNTNIALEKYSYVSLDISPQ